MSNSWLSRVALHLTPTSEIELLNVHSVFVEIGQIFAKALSLVAHCVVIIGRRTLDYIRILAIHLFVRRVFVTCHFVIYSEALRCTICITL